MSFDVNGDIVSWMWDFGDGVISFDVSLIYIYVELGIYFVVLIVIDSEGYIDIVI